MTERELQTLKDEVERLKLFVAASALPAAAIVGADYVARLFDCSERAVVEGRCGTGGIPRIRQKPVGFRKSDVDRALENFGKRNKRKSILKRSRT